MAPLLDIEGLSVEYRTPGGSVRVLRDVSLQVRPGEIVGIVGESGCGKSTLAMAIPGLLPRSAARTGGRLRWNDAVFDDGRQRAARGRDLAIVFQDPMTALNPVLTVGDQLVDYQHRRPGSRAEKIDAAIAMLDHVGIAAAKSRLGAYPHELSGGMRQRVAIAAALLVKPTLLIADEPTTALDVTTEAQILALFRGIRQDLGTAIVIVTHHMGVVAQLCDTVCVMYAGEVLERGSVESVFLEPRHPYTRALLACDPARMAPGTRIFPSIPGVVPSLSAPIEGCAFAARCPVREPECIADGAVWQSSPSGRSVFCRVATP